ncbi:DUF305 domain-containing protein [Streptomyces sp. NPDC049967]|uniref:DUF305 domain-containing protein n=1 Tax=unclassified Streptomyces TaxID=2593676 RepID=UPI00342A3ED5
MKAAPSTAALFLLLLLLLAGCAAPADAKHPAAPAPSVSAAASAADPRIRGWAVRLRTAQNGELARLRPLLARMGLPDTNVHEGHDMPGMVTEHDLEQARAVEGRAFDRLFTALIRDHLRQSAQVSRSETESGTRPDAKRLATALVSARKAELTELDRLPGPSGVAG